MVDRMIESEADAIARQSLRNRARVTAAAHCGCFYCLAVFPGSAMQEWVDNGQTALCPRCGVDAVLADVTDRETLRLLHQLRFEETVGAAERITEAGSARG